jgi:hypothetical protein
MRAKMQDGKSRQWLTIAEGSPAEGGSLKVTDELDELAQEINDVFKELGLPREFWSGWGSIGFTHLGYESANLSINRISFALRRSMIGNPAFKNKIAEFVTKLSDLMQKGLNIHGTERKVQEFDVDLSFSAISGKETMKALQPLFAFPFNHLNLSHNRLGVDGLQNLVEGLSVSNFQLQSLSLGSCKLGNKNSGDKLKDLLKLPALQNLVSLDLSDNQLGAVVVETIINTLTYVDLDFAKKNPGFAARRLSLSYVLEDLDLSGNYMFCGVSPVIKALCRFIGLRQSAFRSLQINLSENYLEAEAIEMLGLALTQLSENAHTLVIVGGNAGLNHNPNISRVFSDNQSSFKKSQGRVEILQKKLSFLGGLIAPYPSSADGGSVFGISRSYFHSHLFDVNTLSIIWEMMGYSHSLKVSVRTWKEEKLAASKANDAWDD